MKLMDEIIGNFFMRRKILIDKNQAECKNKLHDYLHKRNDIEKQIALLLSKLVLLKFEVQRTGSSSHTQSWYQFKTTLEHIFPVLCSECYAIYKSPRRQSVDTHTICLDQSSDTKIPTSNELEILDTRTKFRNKENGCVCNGRIKQNNVQLHINESTDMELPYNYIQLPNDSISIEYLDVFYTRTHKGGIYGQKYKGFDKGIFLKLQSCFDTTMSLDNIEKAIAFAHQFLRTHDIRVG